MFRKNLPIMTLILFVSLVFCFTLVGSASDGNPGVNVEPGHYNLNEYEQMSGKQITEFKESPFLKEKVTSGDLPSVKERLPKNPLVMEPWDEVGQFGGTLYIPGVSSAMRRMGSAPFLETHPAPGVGREGKRLMAKLDPGVLEDYNVSDDGKVFTGVIRKGLKWSDGVPVTTEDVEYYFNDVLYNTDLTPVLPKSFLSRKPVKLEIVDKYTFKITFSKPFGGFPAVIDNFYLQPYYLLRPKHYNKQFHIKYNSWDNIAKLMEKEKYEVNKATWPQFYMDMVGNYYPADNFIDSPYATEIPTLYPWVPVKVIQDEVVEWERNPYYYKVDCEGNQLPYIDVVHQEFLSDQPETVNMKIIAGEVSITTTENLGLQNYPLYMENREKGGYEVMLTPWWRSFPNLVFLTYTDVMHDEPDPAFEKILQDSRIRPALSLSINREEMNENLYLGLGKPVQYAPSPSSPWYKKEYEEAYAEYNPENARKLLDEIGLKDIDNDGFRERPDGEKFHLELLNYNPSWSNDCEMLIQYWQDVGLDISMKTLGGSVYWTRYDAPSLQLSINWSNEPEPTDRGQFTRPARTTNGWKAWIQSDGERGVEPPEWVKKPYEYRDKMFSSTDEETILEYGHKICELGAEHLWYIGTVGRLPNAVIYSKKMGNISIANDMGVHGYMIQEFAPQWFFKK